MKNVPGWNSRNVLKFFSMFFLFYFLVLIKEFKLKLYLPVFIYNIEEYIAKHNIAFFKTTLKFNNAKSVHFLSKYHPQQESSSFYDIGDRVKAIKSIFFCIKKIVEEEKLFYIPPWSYQSLMTCNKALKSGGRFFFYSFHCCTESGKTKIQLWTSCLKSFNFFCELCSTVCSMALCSKALVCCMFKKQ